MASKTALLATATCILTHWGCAPRFAAKDDVLARSMVDVETVYSLAPGFLIDDKRTVMTVQPDLQRSQCRPVNVRMVGSGSDVETDAVTYAFDDRPGWALSLDRDLPGEPLKRSAVTPTLDLPVHIARWSPTTGKGEYVATTLTFIERKRVKWRRVGDVIEGSPVLDASGHALALATGDRHGELLAGLLTKEKPKPYYPEGIVPYFQLGAGVELGGDFPTSALVRGAFGMTVRDQFIFSFAIDGVFGPGNSGFRAGLELKYRWLLHNAARPVYIDLVSGFRAGVNGRKGEPDTGHAALTFGVDVKVWMFAVGYRISPEPVSLVNDHTHMIFAAYSW